MILAYVRTVILYVVLIASVRIMGKRQIGQMEPGTYRCYSQSGEFLMLAKVEDSIMSTVKSFFEVE